MMTLRPHPLKWGPFIFFLCTVSAFTGCLPTSVELARLSQKDDFKMVQTKGEQWLLEAEEEDKQSPEGRKVKYLVANAELRLAMQTGGYKALKKFRQKYEAEYPKMNEKAYRLESKLYFETVAQKDDTPSAYREFRRLYPRSELVPRSKQDELRAATRLLNERPDEQRALEFRTFYSSWESATALVALAERVYIQEALARMVEKKQLTEIQTFRAENSIILKRHQLDVQAFDAEMKTAFQAIENSTDRATILAFIAKYESAGADHSIIAKAMRRADLQIQSAFEEARDSDIPSALSAFREQYAESDADHPLLIKALKIEMTREYESAASKPGIQGLKEFVFKQYELGRQNSEVFKRAQTELYTRALQVHKGIHTVVKVSEFHVSWRINTDLEWKGKWWKGIYQGKKRRFQAEEVPPMPMIEVQDNLDIRVTWKGESLGTVNLASDLPNSWVFDPTREAPLQTLDVQSKNLHIWLLDPLPEKMSLANDDFFSACFDAGPWLLMATPEALIIDCGSIVDGKFIFARSR